MKKMKQLVNALVVVIGVTFAHQAAYAAQGDSEATAKSLAMSQTLGSDTAQTLYCTNLFGYGFNWTWTLTKKATYTIRVPEAEAMRTQGPHASMDFSDLSSRPNAIFTNCGVFDGYAYYLMRDSSWFDSDPNTAPYFMGVTGEQGANVTVEYGQGNHLPEGSTYNPKRVDIGANLQTNSLTLLSGYGDMRQPYCYRVQLSKGDKYYFQATGGSEQMPLTLEVRGDADAKTYETPSVTPLHASSGNARILVEPTTNGTYQVAVRSATDRELKFVYGRYSERALEEHPASQASVGETVTCRPGRMHANQSFQDDVIDERLYVFDADGLAGKTLYLESSGATGRLLGCVYDASGKPLATVKSQSDFQLRFSFAVPEGASRFYLGICQDIPEETGASPLDMEMSFKLHDVAKEGLFRYDPADPSDDQMAGAATIEMAAVERTLERTLWGTAPVSTDDADWFAFDATVGASYNFRTTGGEGQLDMALYDAGSNRLMTAEAGVLVYAPASDGRLYLNVSRRAGFETADIAYALTGKLTEAGVVSFSAPEYEVQESASAVTVTVVRTSGAGRAYVRWGTVSGTAVAGENYVATGGTLVLDGAGASSSLEIPVALLREMRPTISEDRVFYVRLDRETDVQLEYGESAPVVVEPNCAKIVIRESDTQDVPEPVQPQPSVDPSYVTSGSGPLKLAYGSFNGLLRLTDDADVVSEEKLGHLSVEITASGISARTEIAGQEETFSSSEYDLNDGFLTALLTSASSDSTISLTVQNASISTLLDGFAADSGLAVLSRAVSDAFGPVESIPYSATLYRNNAKEGPYHAVTAALAGKYTVAFAPVAGASIGYGFASIALAESGEAAITGCLPDGTTFGATAIAAASSGPVLRIPFLSPVADGVFGGTLVLKKEQDGIRRISGLERELPCLFRGETVIEFNPVGAFYDDTLVPEAVATRFDFTADDEGAGVLAPDSLNGAALSVDQETGALSGKIPVSAAVGGGMATVSGIVFSPVEGWTGPLAMGTIGNGRAPIRVWGTPVVSPAENWGFNVVVSFEGTDMTLLGSAGELVTIPVCDPPLTRDGYTFAGWRDADGNLRREGAAFRIPPLDCMLSAVWSKPTVGFSTALDCEDSFEDADFLAEGQGWEVVEDASAINRNALLTPLMRTRGMSSSLETMVQGAGHLSFRWKFSKTGRSVVTGGKDSIRFLLDGQEIAAVETNMTGWARFEMDVVTVGKHSLQWVVERNSIATMMSIVTCSGGLDDFSFAPYVQVTFDADGGSCPVDKAVYLANSVFCDLPVATWGAREFLGWHDAQGKVYSNGVDRVPDVERLALKARWAYHEVTVNYDKGRGTGSVPSSHTGRYPDGFVVEPADLQPPAGYGFSCWISRSGDRYLPGDRYPYADTDDVLTAHFTPSTVGYAAALDSVPSGVSDDDFNADGDGVWITVEDATAVGGTALQSEPLSAAGQEILLETEVSGPCVVGFAWQLLYDAGARTGGDAFALEVDGQEVLCLDAQSEDWERAKLPLLDSSAHKLAWIVRRGANAATGQVVCKGRLDDFSLTAPVVVRFDAKGGSCDVTEDVWGAGTRFFGLPVPTYPGMEFYGWATSDGTAYDNGDVVPSAETLDLEAQWGAIRSVLSYELGGATGKEPDPVHGAAPDTAVVAKPTKMVPPSGKSFFRWQGSDSVQYRPGDLFAFAGEDVVLTPVWSESTVGFAEALDCADSFEDSDFYRDDPWSVVSDSVCSGTFNTKGTSRTFKLELPGPGKVTFKWLFTKTGATTAASSGGIAFAVDGVQKAAVAGTTAANYSSGWQEVSCEVEGPGRHVLTWTVSHSFTRSGMMGALPSCSGSVDSFSFEPLGKTVTIRYGQDVSSVTFGGEPVADGESIVVADASIEVSVAATDWHAPACAAAFVTTTAAQDDKVKTFVIAPAGDCEVSFTANAYAGDASGMIEIGGKRVSAVKATGWAIAHSVAESAFAANYDDYLLNEAPGAGGGIVVTAIALEGDDIVITVGRTKDSYSLDAINGGLKLLAAETLGEAFEDVPSVTWEAVAAKATVRLLKSATGGRFFKVEVR